MVAADPAGAPDPRAMHRLRPMVRQLLLGIDDGTSAVKVVAYDLDLRPARQRATRRSRPAPTAGLGGAGRGRLSWTRSWTRSRRCSTRPMARSLPAASTTRASRWSRGMPTTGEPRSPIIVWQDKRGAEMLARLSDADRAEVRPPQRPAARPVLLRRLAGVGWWPTVGLGDRAGVRLGTLDAYLSRPAGCRLATDPSTASRTQLSGVVGAGTGGLGPAAAGRCSGSRAGPAADHRQRRRPGSRCGTLAGARSCRSAPGSSTSRLALAGTGCVRRGSEGDLRHRRVRARARG